jgi:hypothetical protein
LHITIIVKNNLKLKLIYDQQSAGQSVIYCKLLLDLVRAVTLTLKSCRTHGHILLSHLRLSQPGGPGPRIYIPQEQGGPVIPPGTGRKKKDMFKKIKKNKTREKTTAQTGNNVRTCGFNARLLARRQFASGRSCNRPTRLRSSVVFLGPRANAE